MSRRDRILFIFLAFIAIVVAITVLNSAIGAPPDTRTAPDRLIVQLGSDDFEVREEAQAALLTHDWYEIGPLLRFHSDHPDAEVRTRVRRIAATLRERAVGSFGTLPMCDASYFNILRGDYDYDSEAHCRTEVYLERVGGRDVYPYDNFRLATRLIVAEWIEEGRSEASIRLQLVRWHAVDTIFCLCRWQQWKNLRADPVNEMGVTWWQRVVFLCGK